MKTSSTSASAKYMYEEKSSKAVARKIDFPLMSQFYESPELPPIIESKEKLKYATAAICVITAVVFALLIYQGITTVQEIILDDKTKVLDTICHPSSSPVNCPNGIVDCPTDLLYFYSSGTGWEITMKNVYFESFADCVSKLGSILNDTIASTTSYTNPYGKQIDMIWSPYKGPISIGDQTAEFQVALTFSLRSQQGDPFVSTGGSTGATTCASDSTNFNSDGSVISNSAVDIFAKSIPSHLLQNGYWYTGGSYCPSEPTPENICQPIVTVGPYSCTKTTKITQPVLQVLGSSFSNATTLMTVLSMALAWIIQKGDKKTADSTEKVAPNVDLCATADEPSK